MIETEDQLGGTPVAPGDPFPFRCGPHLSCFGGCCRHKRLPLFPYDLLRLRRALGLGSAELLAAHAELELDPGSGWPALRIRLRDDGTCPFLGARGCRVYEHRPFCCRIYPLARAVAPGDPGCPPRETFIAARPEGCLGLGDADAGTVADYLDGQGLGPYREANNRLLALLLHPHRGRPVALSERQMHAFVMALCNLDVWRRAVATPGFAVHHRVDEARVARALRDDLELLHLGQDWVTAELFGRQ